MRHMRHMHGLLKAAGLRLAGDGHGGGAWMSIDRFVSASGLAADCDLRFAIRDT